MEYSESYMCIYITQKGLAGSEGYVASLQFFNKTLERTRHHRRMPFKSKWRTSIVESKSCATTNCSTDLCRVIKHQLIRGVDTIFKVGGL